MADTDTATDSKELIRVPASAVAFGITPRNLEEGIKLANFMAKSSLVPKDFQGHPENVLIAIQMGAEIGLAPMQALQSIAVINGRPSIWGDGFLALLMAAPSYEDHDEYYLVAGKRADILAIEDLNAPDTMAVCTFIRRGKKLAVTRTFSIANAKKAGLWTKPGPWVNYPERMLRMRARGFAGRDCFPDVLRGIGIAEEVMDIPDRPEIVVTPITSPRRAVAAAPDPPADVDLATGELHEDEPPTPNDSDAPASETPADPKPAAANQAAAQVPPGVISAPRVRRLYAMAKGHRTNEALHAYVRELLKDDAEGDPLARIPEAEYARICTWAEGKD